MTGYFNLNGLPDVSGNIWTCYQEKNHETQFWSPCFDQFKKNHEKIFTDNLLYVRCSAKVADFI